VIVNPRKVAERYLKGWFIMDIFIIACDLTSLSATFLCEDCVSSGGRNLRLVRLTRIMRSITLLRTSRLVPKLEGLLETHRFGDKMAFGLWLLRMAFLVCWGNHLITCVWWTIGRRGYSDTGNRWVEDVLDNERYLDVSKTFQYIIAFHWALSQICLGAAQVHARNVVEQVFTVICLLAGLLLGTSLISLLSAEMVNEQMARRKRTDKLKLMRRFLRQYGINPKQAASVQVLVEERMDKKQPLSEHDFPGLDLLPTSVRMELRYCICKPCLFMHPLLRTWIGLSEAAVQRLCMDAAHLSHRRPNDEVLVAGEHAKEAYILKSGRGVYEQKPSSAPVLHEQVLKVKGGQVIAEAAMWTEWVYVGTLILTEYSEVFVLSVKDFVKAIGHHALLQDTAIEYGRLFHSRLISARPPRCDYPSDVHIPLTDFEELVFHMSPQVSMAICMHAVLAFRQKWTTHLLHSVQKLENEVRSGRSVVLMNDKGFVRRVVSVVALRLENHMGEIFVHVADAADGAVAPAVHLPGGKQERGERELDSLERIMRSKLRPLDGKVVVHGMKRADTEEESYKHHMPTKYLRTMCYGRLRTGVGLDARCVECGMVDLPSKQSQATSSPFPRSSSAMRLTGSAKSNRRVHYGHDDELRGVLNRLGAAVHAIGHAAGESKHKTREMFRKSSDTSDSAKAEGSPAHRPPLREVVEESNVIPEFTSQVSFGRSFPLAGKLLQVYKTHGGGGGSDGQNDARGKYGLFAWLTQAEFDELSRARKDGDPRLQTYLHSINLREVEECGEANLLLENPDADRLAEPADSPSQSSPTAAAARVAVPTDFVCVDI